MTQEDTQVMQIERYHQRHWQLALKMQPHHVVFVVYYDMQAEEFR